MRRSVAEAARPGRRWWRWAQGLAGVAIVGYAARLLISNWGAVRGAPLEWAWRPLPLIASVALVLATYALLAEAWRRMVHGWGIGVPRWTAARIWVLSSMGKYLPGKVWTLAGMAVLAQGAGVPPGVAAASAILLQLISLATGAVVIAATGLVPARQLSPDLRLGIVVLLGVVAVGLALLLRPGAVNAVLGRLVGPAGRLPGPPASRSVAFGALANGMAWVWYGVAVYWLAAGLFEASGLELRTAIAAFTASYVAGFLFLVAPGGLGVRESVFVLLTQSALGPAQALALAAGSRVAMTVADLLAAAPFLRIRRPGVAT
jgi:hypothetical protein